MLYIIGYWHAFEYTDLYPNFNNAFAYELTMIALGLFIVISGFLIGHSAVKASSVMCFYKKRLIRVYPLYALAIFLFYVYGLNDAETSLKSMVFVSMYYGPPPLTLWFITMLFLFYIATPFIIKLVQYPVQYLLFILTIFSITYIISIYFETVDLRVLLYFPSFCLGIYCSQHGIKNRAVNFWSASLLFLFGLAVLFIDIDSWIINQLKHIPMILSASYLILTLSIKFEEKFTRLKLITLLSYSSFAMYLFHRPIIISLKSLYFPENNVLQVVYLLTVCLFMIALISWALQKSYDKLSSSFTNQLLLHFKTHIY